jgi:hypothetical protein
VFGADAFFLHAQCIMQELEQNKSMVETDEGQTKLKQARRSFKKSVKIRPDDEAQNYLQQIEKLLN